MNKEICKRCIDKAHDQNPNVRLWNELDEKVWNQGWVYCPTIANSSMKNGGVSISGKLPPKECFYYFEHLVINDDGS